MKQDPYVMSFFRSDDHYCCADLCTDVFPMLNTHPFPFADNSLQCSNTMLPLHPRHGIISISISISHLLHMHGKVDAMVVVLVGAVVDQVGPGLVQSGQGAMTTAVAAATRAGNVDSDLSRTWVLAPASHKVHVPLSDFLKNLLNPLPANCKTVFLHYYFPQLCELHLLVVSFWFDWV
jgi:hypothetical protein